MKSGRTLKNFLGDIYHFDGDDERHCEDGPAIIQSNGHKEWYIHGIHHREGNLPTIVTDQGDLTWHKKGEFVHHYNKFNSESFIGRPVETAEEIINEIEGKGLEFPVETKQRLMELSKKEKMYMENGESKDDAVRKARNC